MNVFLLFRLSVVLSFVLPCIGGFCSYFMESSFPDSWQDVLAWDGDGSLIPLDCDFSETTPLEMVAFSVFAVLAIIAIANQIALFFYWRPARQLYLVLTVIFYIESPILGLTVLTPFDNICYSLGHFLAGITLALAYYSPVAERFTKKVTPPPIP